MIQRDAVLNYAYRPRYSPGMYTMRTDYCDPDTLKESGENSKQKFSI